MFNVKYLRSQLQESQGRGPSGGGANIHGCHDIGREEDGVGEAEASAWKAKKLKGQRRGISQNEHYMKKSHGKLLLCKLIKYI